MREMLAAIFCVISRYQPLRHKTGVFHIGHPSRHSPVFVSGNYYYTVRELSKNLRGLQCYLLVADSAGINVWCAAGAGDFTEHKIADAVNTYKLKALVDHRDLILPQLCAVGVDRDKLAQECGFTAKWGPASYLDIKEYVSAGFQCSDRMRRVSSSLGNRLRIATGILSAYLFFGGIAYLLSYLVLGVWAGWAVGSISVLLAVQSYAAAFSDRMIFKWPTNNILLVAMLLSGMIGTLGLAGLIRPQAMWLHIGATVVIAVLLCVDYIGSTVDYKSTIGHWLKTFDLRSLFQPEVTDRCTGCDRCAEVCPKRMYKMHAGRATVDQDKDCCECLACVKQCPHDAIRNANAGPLKGDIATICDIERILKS